jgi:hypothetical protein
MNGSTTASKRSPPLRDRLIDAPASYPRIVWHVESETPLDDRSVVGAVAWGRAKQETLSASHGAKGRRPQTRGLL